MARKPQKKKEAQTTGHSWDGIEELDTPLPRWWLWVFYACIIWGIWYVIAYPAWPLIYGATPGYKGWSTRGQLEKDIAKADAANAEINAKLVKADISSIPNNPELATYARAAGGAIFRTWCAQCHGAGAAGAKGFPNLLDDDWLWGGTMEDIHTTITHGIRSEKDPDTRYSEMPVWGEMLEPDEIKQAANYVMTLSGGTPKDAQAAKAGKEVFLDNCAACHGEDGSGDRSQGAPALNDAIWLYGGDYDTIVESITKGRHGIMPNWNARLSEAEIRAVATYVHQLGGGE